MANDEDYDDVPDTYYRVTIKKAGAPDRVFEASKVWIDFGVLKINCSNSLVSVILDDHTVVEFETFQAYYLP